MGSGYTDSATHLATTSWQVHTHLYPPVEAKLQASLDRIGQGRVTPASPSKVPLQEREHSLGRRRRWWNAEDMAGRLRKMWQLGAISTPKAEYVLGKSCYVPAVPCIHVDISCKR